MLKLLEMGTLLRTADHESVGHDFIIVVINPGDEGGKWFTAAGGYVEGGENSLSLPGTHIDASIVEIVGKISPQAVIDGLRIGLFDGSVPDESAELLKEYATKPGRKVTIPDKT